MNGRILFPLIMGIFLFCSLPTSSIAQDDHTAALQNWLKELKHFFNGPYKKSLPLLKKEAEQGNAEAQGKLGFMYISDGDVQQGVYWLQKSADQGHQGAQGVLNDVEMQGLIASRYYKGEGVKQNSTMAAEWAKKAAEQGDADAQCLLGILYALGEGVPRNTQLAVLWLKKTNSKEAQQILQFIGQNKNDSDSKVLQAAIFYMQGRSKEALTLLQKAAEQGNVAAQAKLGYMYAVGQNVPENKQFAVAWLQKAVAQGSKEAKENLDVLANATIAQETIKLKQAFNLLDQARYKEALPVLQKAAEQGNAKAQGAIGLMYLKGTGVAKNEQKAVLWLRKAAGQGLKEAQDVVNAITAERRRHDESVRLFSESACDRVVAVDLQAAAACRGDCNLIINNFNAFRACSGDCNDIQGNSNVRLACEGNCSALRDPAAGYACHSCGGGPAWTSMYLLGFVMKCD